MTKEEIMAFAQHIAKRFLESGKSANLSELIAKIADEFSLNREFIKLLVNETNRAVFLRLFETSQDKTVEFPIAKFEEVIAILNRDMEPEIHGVHERASEIDESLFDVSDLYAMPAEKVERMVEPDPLIEEKNRRAGNARIIVLVQQAKTASNEAGVEQAAVEQAKSEIEELLKPFVEAGLSVHQVKMLLRDELGDLYTDELENLIQQMYDSQSAELEGQPARELTDEEREQAIEKLKETLLSLKDNTGQKTAAEDETIRQLRAVLQEMLKYGVNINEIHILLEQSLGSNYTSDMRKLIENEYKNLLMQTPSVPKVASLKRAIDLVKTIELDTGYGVQKLASEVASMHPETLARAIQLAENPDKVQAVVVELLKYDKLRKEAQLRDRIYELQGTIRDNRVLFEKLAQAQQRQYEHFRKIAESIGNALKIARTPEQRAYIRTAIRKIATEAQKKTFWDKMTDFFGAVSAPLNVVNQSLGVAVNVKQLQSLDLDLKAKREQYRKQGLLPKYGSMKKTAAGGTIAAAANVLSKIKPVASKVLDFLAKPETQLLVNMGFATTNNIIQDKIEDKMDEIERLDAMASRKNLLMNKKAAADPLTTLSMVKDVTTKAKRPFDDEVLVEAIAKRNPNINESLIRRTVNTLKLYAPGILDDPFLVDEVVRRVHIYGGLDPSYLSSLTDFSSKALRHMREQGQ